MLGRARKSTLVLRGSRQKESARYHFGPAKVDRFAGRGGKVCAVYGAFGEIEYRDDLRQLCASMKTSIAIYPGSFDPVTNGHLDLIERGEKMFDLLIVAVLRNTDKQPLFTVPERVEMLREVTKRGIRAVSDYEYELQMALMNRKLEPRLETVFMLPGEPYSYLSAKLVREIAQLGGPLEGLVPPGVEERLRAKI
jgi:pantetheine-phosphate adenylyltransferase